MQRLHGGELSGIQQALEFYDNKKVVTEGEIHAKHLMLTRMLRFSEGPHSVSIECHGFTNVTLTIN